MLKLFWARLTKFTTQWICENITVFSMIVFFQRYLTMISSMDKIVIENVRCENNTWILVNMSES